MSGDERRVGVVGAGIVGLAVARRLLETRPGVEVTVFDKEPEVGRHQTGHNSGVVHAGLYYPADSLKARLCRRGVGLLREYCQERGIEYVECGKTVVALTDDEVPRLRAIEERATRNGVPGLRWLSAAGIREHEPHVTGVAGLHSPSTAIVDFVAVTRAYAEDVVAGGGRLLLGTEVEEIERAGDVVRVTAGGERHELDHLVVCAGLQSDRVARLAGDAAEPAIVPFRGEYLTMRPDRAHLVRGLVYPVPDPRYPFLGVHFTRRVDGTVDIGPNAVLSTAREGYRRSDVVLRDLAETLAWPGFRRMARQHWRMGLTEMRGSLSRRAFVAGARRYLPELTVADVDGRHAGVRAQALDRDGSLVDDFRISRLGRVTAVRNAPSPAATSSLAIAEHLVP
ncbi:L-2-hydroxyglutarate oxidase [Nocardioides sp. MAHUQ-72]|uniref:L-2-hydroxyglutarate oxidase n=1 Tax=unclassified Nocardioides TaxID=2615069 RepID=UPI0036168B56